MTIKKKEGFFFGNIFILFFLNIAVFFFLFFLLNIWLSCWILVFEGFCGRSKGKVLGEPLLALGVRGVDGRVLRFRRASGRKRKVQNKQKWSQRQREINQGRGQSLEEKRWTHWLNSTGFYPSVSAVWLCCSIMCTSLICCHFITEPNTELNSVLLWCKKGLIFLVWHRTATQPSTVILSSRLESKCYPYNCTEGGSVDTFFRVQGASAEDRRETWLWLNNKYKSVQYSVSIIRVIF